MKRFSLYCLFLVNVQITIGQQSYSTPNNFFDLRKQILSNIKNETVQFNEPEDEKDNAMAKFKRWEQFMLPRVGPKGVMFNSDAVYNAYNNYYAQNKTPFNINPWSAIGPFYDPPSGPYYGTRVGVGRVNCIAQHPLDSQTLYIGSMGGGIWKTINGGRSWTCLDNQLPSMSISDIAINPIHPDTMYIATGDAIGNYTITSNPDFHQGHYSCGVLMSTNGGLSWQPTGFTYEQYQTENIYRMIIDPIQPHHLLLGCDKGLFRSTNSGNSWTQLDTTRTYDLLINPLDATKYYALTNNSQKLKRSYDGGASFKIVNLTNLVGASTLGHIRISAADTSKIYVLRGAGQLIRSDNGGKSFKTINNLSNPFFHQGNYDKAFALSPVDTSIALIGLVDLVKTTNTSKTYVKVDSIESPTKGIHVDFHSLQFSIFNPSTIYAANDGGIYVSHDVGETWNSLNNGLNITQYYKLNTSNLKPNSIIAGAQDNSTHLFDGTNWFTVNAADGLDCSFDQGDEQVVYAAIQYGYLYRSDDGGATFYNLITPTEFQGDWESPFIINPLNNKHLYFAGNKIYLSYDKGDHWNIISPVLDENLPITSIAMSKADTNTIYVASYHNIFVTQNNGISWENITNGLPSDSASITDVKLSDVNSKIIYVTFSGFHDGKKVYQSNDGGKHWNNISGSLPNIPMNTIAIQNNTLHDIYVGSDFGVFYKNDTLIDWKSYNNGMPGVIISDLDINTRNGKLYAATHGRGIYSVDLFTPSDAITQDASITQIISPERLDYCDSVSSQLIIALTNYGTDTLKSVRINYVIDNQPQAKLWTGKLPSKQTLIDTIENINLSGGVHHIIVNTSMPNQEMDQYSLNDEKTRFIFINNSTVPKLMEDFESGFDPPLEWFQTGNMWTEIQGYGGFGLSQHALLAPFFNFLNGTDYFISPRIDLKNTSATVLLTFSRAYGIYEQNYKDTLMISISTDCGLTWLPIYRKTSVELATTLKIYNDAFTPTPSDWVKDTVDLTMYKDHEIKLRFEGHSGFGNLLFLDDININGTIVSTKNNKISDINIYPNPTQGIVYIDDPNHEVYKILLFDQQGKSIANETSITSNQILDLSNYPNQTFIIKLMTQFGVIVKKIVHIN